MAKAAAIFVIALVLVAAVLLRPLPGDVDGPATPAPILARALSLHAVALPGTPLRTAPSFRVDSEPARSRFRVDSEPVQSRFRVDSEPVRSRFRMDSEPVQSRFRVDSEYDGTAGRTNIAPLEARALDGTADFAPSTSADAVETARPGPVSRAFSTAANQTSGAFRTARRAVRSVF